MKYIYSISQMSMLSLTLCTFSITGLVAGLFLTLPSDQSLALLHLSFLLPSSEQVRLVPTVKKPLVLLAKLGTLAIVAIIPLCCLTLELIVPVLIISSTFLLLSCSPSSSCLEQWPDHTTAQLSQFATLNSFLMSTKNSLAISYSNNPASKSSSMFSFQTSADPPCTYNNTHCICSSTVTPLIFILMYNLHAIMNPATFLELSLNFYGFTTSTCILDLVNTATLSLSSSSA